MQAPGHPFGALEMNIRILVRQSDDWWEAQVLEYDVAAQAKTRDDVLYEVMRTFFCEVAVNLKHRRAPLDNMRPAPEMFWQAWEAATPETKPPVLRTFQVPSEPALSLTRLRGEVRAAA